MPCSLFATAGSCRSGGSGSGTRPCGRPAFVNDEGEQRVFRGAGISYLRIPADDPKPTATFYRRVFWWTVDTSRPDPSFEDGTGHVIGHFTTDTAVVGEAGVRPYIFVERVD